MTPSTRTLLVALVSSLLLVWSDADAQQAGKPWRIGLLFLGTPAAVAPNFDAFRQGMRDLGYVEGQNVLFEPRYAGGRPELWPELATDLVRLNVDLIVSPGPAARQVRDATSTIPVVFLLGADPVAFGLVDSFERPGRNLTGTMENNPELTAVRLRLLHEASPGVTRVGLLWQPGTLTEATLGEVLKNAHTVASSLGVQLHPFEAREPGQFEKVFADMASAQVNGLIVIQSPMFAAQRQAIITLAAQHNVPTIYEWGVYVASGGLMSYGANLLDEFRRAAPYVDKILKGAKPADLPVEQPTKFELVINAKTAKALGLTIPKALLLRANQVIE